MTRLYHPMDLTCWVLPKGLQTVPRSYDVTETHSLPAVPGHPNILWCFPPQLLYNLPLLPAPRAPFAPTASAEVVLCSPGSISTPFSQAHLGPFSCIPQPHRVTLHRLPSYPLGTGWRDMPGLGQQEARPKGQQTVGSRPHTRASRLRIQLCFHGNVQSLRSMVPSHAAVAALCTTKSFCHSQPLPGPASSDPLRTFQSPAD